MLFSFRKKTAAVLIRSVIVILFLGSAATGARAPRVEKAEVLIGFHWWPGKSDEHRIRAAGGTIKRSFRLVPAMAASVPVTAIDALRRAPGIARIEPDGVVQIADAELDNSWGVKRIGAGYVHDSGNTGAGVNIAIIDTGIDYTHPDLADNYAGGWNFIYNNNNPMDDNKHGTHVAGIAAALDNDIGVVGVAPHVRLYALKSFGWLGTSKWSDIIAALDWCVSHGIQVANHSYASTVDPGQTVKDAFDNAYAAGIVHVAAAGNYGACDGSEDNVAYPAKYDSVIAVAATDNTDNRACFSCTGPDVELAAPGVDVNSTYFTLYGGGYIELSGTSMATPTVAGTAALIIAGGIQDENANGRINDEVRAILNETAEDLGDPGRDPHYGFGLVDAFAAAEGGTGDRAPTVSIVNPNEGEVVYGNVPILVAASDAEDAAGDLVVEWTLDGVTWLSAAHNGETGFYEDVWDTIDQPDDTQRMIRARASDTAGQTTLSAAVTVTINNVNDKPVADFTSACSGSTCQFDASASHDNDGSIVSFEWNFGDGHAGSGKNVSHTYSQSGTYTVELTVTDDRNDLDNTSQNIEIPEVTDTHHIGDLDASSRTLFWDYWEAKVFINVLDAAGNPVPTARVYGRFSDRQFLFQCTTNSSGTCSVVAYQWTLDCLTYTVADVEHYSTTYQPGANWDPDGDSDGTNITVCRP